MDHRQIVIPPTGNPNPPQAQAFITTGQLQVADAEIEALLPIASTAPETTGSYPIAVGQTQGNR